MLPVVFWVSGGLLAWVYLGYPLLVGIVGRVRPVGSRLDRAVPTLSIAIAVHDEASEIVERVANVLAQDSPDAPVLEVLVGSDGSTDGTDDLVRALAAADDRIRLRSLARAGQTATQRVLFDAAAGEVVVLTDAETRFEAGCLAAIARAFRDERVGCATGRLEWRSEDATATSANEGLYWRYERAVRNLESRAGLLTAVTGALLAVRRASYRPVPATASMDHLLPLYVREQGGLVVYVPDAVGTDRPISGLREQFRNRTRTATRGIVANLSMAGRLAPWRHPGAALAVWSHKLARWATPWLGGLVVVSATGLALEGRAIFWLVPIAALTGVAAAAIGQLLAGTGRRPPRLLAFARALAVVNIAFATAWINVAFGRRIEAWHRAEWSTER